MLTTVLQYTHH